MMRVDVAQALLAGTGRLMFLLGRSLRDRLKPHWNGAAKLGIRDLRLSLRCHMHVYRWLLLFPEG